MNKQCLIGGTETCTAANGAACASGHVFEIEYFGYLQSVITAV